MIDINSLLSTDNRFDVDRISADTLRTVSAVTREETYRRLKFSQVRNSGNKNAIIEAFLEKELGIKKKE